MRIAQRFNAGVANECCQIPKGRLNDGGRGLLFSRPSGTYCLGTAFPALKRRAIVGSPFGTIPQIICT